MKLESICPVPLPEADLTEEVVIGSGCRTQLEHLAQRHLGKRPLLVADPDTWAALDMAEYAGPKLILEKHPHADDETVERLVGSMGDHSGLIAVGSGTVNDLAKRAAHLRRRPYIVVGTAASMNGYASGIAAILSGGLKTTVPARPPRAIILDTDILAGAPRLLTQAGLGDLISKPVSDTDWWLADMLEGTGYSDLPSRVVDVAVEAAIRSAPGLLEGAPAAHGDLGRALVLSGVAMVVAGSSSPASGGEHLISHLWDMERLQRGEQTRLHGAQVGVTTCITAALYQALIKLDAADVVDMPTWTDERRRIETSFGGLSAVVLGPAQEKFKRRASRMKQLHSRWPEIRAGLSERRLPSPDFIRNILQSAGAASSLLELDEPRGNALRVFRLARDIRDRVTVLDVGFETGLLPARAAELLDASGV